MSRYSHPTISRTAKSLSQPANPDNRLIVDSRSSHDRGAVMPTRWDSTALDLLRGREPEGVLLAPPLGESRQVGLDCAAPATPPVYAGSPLTLSSSHSTSPGGGSRRVGFDEAVLMMTVPTSRSPFFLSPGLWRRRKSRKRLSRPPGRTCGQANADSRSVAPPLPTSPFGESRRVGFRGAFGRGPPSPAL